MSQSASIDRLSAVLEQFPVRAGLFHHGPLCGTQRFPAQPGRAFVHVLRRGALQLGHARGSGAPMRLSLDRPTLLFYPRALEHRFRQTPREGSDFTCATVEFAGGDAHPIARALPPLVLVPLEQAPELAPVLELLFRETAQLRCGSRLLADRLFEVLVLQLLRWLLDRGRVSEGLVAGLGDARLARALTAVHERPGEDWSVAALARLAGMSRSAFSARFRQVLGLTPAEYVIQWRLERACVLLRQGRPLGWVADALGYSGHAALSRVFRQRRGLSPRQWLREQRQASAAD